MAICSGVFLIPVLAVLLSKNFNWTAEDFLMAAVLIFGAGLAIEIGLRVVKNQKYKSLIIIGVILLAILLFMEMAVGIFGSPLAGD